MPWAGDPPARWAFFVCIDPSGLSLAEMPNSRSNFAVSYFFDSHTKVQ